MWLRLRQICLVAEKLAPVEEAICDVFGVKVCYRDPGVGKFGLENALFPFGNQLLEVVAPTEPNTAAGRYLERRGGDGGYMFITQCDDIEPRRARVEALGIRLAHQFERPAFANMQLHPRDTGGTFFEIDEQRGPNAHGLDGPWHPAGADWQADRALDRVTGFAAAEIQCDDPAALSKRWSEIAEIELSEENGRVFMQLDNASCRFVPCTDDRPEGLGSIDVSVTDKDALRTSAKARNALTGDDQVYLCGTRFNLV
jgi:hypothetical protein